MRILILGVSGMVGHMAYRILSARHDTLGTCRGRYADHPALPRVLPPERCLDQVDATDAPRLREAIRAARPDVLLNCVGLTPHKAGPGDTQALVRLNGSLPHELAAEVEAWGGRLIQVSTDCVFSGRKGGYAPSDPPDPVDAYGRSKVLGEVVRGPHLTLRTSVVGRQLAGAEGLFEWFLSRRGGVVRGFVHAIYSGLTTRAFASLLVRLLDRHPSLAGLYHVASAPISKYDLLTGLARRLRLATEVVPDESVRCDRSLDGSAFSRATGLTAPGWGEMLDGFAEDFERYEIWRAAA